MFAPTALKDRSVYSPWSSSVCWQEFLSAPGWISSPPPVFQRKLARLPRNQQLSLFDGDALNVQRYPAWVDCCHDSNEGRRSPASRGCGLAMRRSHLCHRPDRGTDERSHKLLDGGRCTFRLVRRPRSLAPHAPCANGPRHHRLSSLPQSA